MGREMIGGNGYCRRLVCIVLESNGWELGLFCSLAGVFRSEERDCAAVAVRQWLWQNQFCGLTKNAVVSRLPSSSKSGDASCCKRQTDCGGISVEQRIGLELVGADPGAGFCLAPTQELYAGKLPQVAACSAGSAWATPEAGV